MERRQYAAVALLVVGLVAIPNGMWLFPHEGETRYTYERTPLVVENGTLAPRAEPLPAYTERHHLREVDCDRGLSPRDCVLDRHLLSEGPVTVTGDADRVDEPRYTRIEGDYYRRVVTTNASRTTLDVRAVDAEQVREDLAVRARPVDASAVRDSPPGYRAVATGDPARSFVPPHEAALGRVYVQNGTHYTPIVARERQLDRPLLSSGTRSGLSYAGAMGAFVLAPLLFASGSDRGPF
jgi:hypothetical protein